MCHQNVKRLSTTQWHNTFWPLSFYLMFIEWPNFNFTDVDIFLSYITLEHTLKGFWTWVLNQIFNLRSQIHLCGTAWVSLISTWNTQHHWLCHEELMTQHFIDICFAVISDAFFQSTDAHSACFNGCMFSGFWPGGSTEGFQSQFAWGQTMFTACLNIVNKVSPRIDEVSKSGILIFL